MVRDTVQCFPSGGYEASGGVEAGGDGGEVGVKFRWIQGSSLAGGKELGKKVFTCEGSGGDVFSFC